MDFFSEKKSKFEGEKKPRKKFSKLKFGFFHMDGPIVCFLTGVVRFPTLFFTSFPTTHHLGSEKKGDNSRAELHREGRMDGRTDGCVERGPWPFKSWPHRL